MPESVGRPSKLTPQLQAEIVALIEKGHFVEITCERAGISKECFYNWLRRAENGESPYIEFSDAIKKAEQVAEDKALSAIQNGEDDWQSRSWFLERRHYQRWGRRDADADIKNQVLKAQIVLLEEQVKQLQSGTVNQPMQIELRPYREQLEGHKDDETE